MSSTLYPDRNDPQPIATRGKAGTSVEREWPLDPPLPGVPNARSFGKALDYLVFAAAYDYQRRPIAGGGGIGWFRDDKYVLALEQTPRYVTDPEALQTLRDDLKADHDISMGVTGPMREGGAWVVVAGVLGKVEASVVVTHPRRGVAIAVAAILAAEAAKEEQCESSSSS